MRAPNTRILDLIVSSLGRVKSLAKLSPPAATVALCLILTPLMSLVHQATTLAIAGLLQAIGHWGVFLRLTAVVPFDPIYASVLDKTLGNIQVEGLAIVSPLGDVLHKFASGVFAPPDQVTGVALVAPLVSNGASLLALTLAEAGGEVLFIAIGLALLVKGLRGSKVIARSTLLALCLFGVILQVKGVIGLLSLRFSPQDLEIMGVAHLFTKLFPMEASTYHRLADGPLLNLTARLLPISFVVAIYGPLLVIGFLRYAPWRSITISLRSATHALQQYLHLFQKNVSQPMLVVIAIPAGVILLQISSPTLGEYQYPTPSVADPAPPEAVVLSPEPESPPTSLHEPPKAGPSKVVIQGSNFNYSYLVNGQPERIQGVGYNVMYSGLSTEERAVRYNRDFAQMQAVGINTILGWNQQEFDELTLEKANEKGLGVIMPYHLSPNGEYGNPEYEQKLEDDIKGWVRRYRDHPALRMWGIGNEVIHGMGEKPDSPRARAFAQFYLRLVDAVHAIDPDHPVIYRGAEDVYLAPFKRVLQNDGLPRPWLVYGANFFTFRIEKVLNEWSQKGPDVPLVVSEFAPCGLGQGDRPRGYLRMWQAIAQHSTSVLGGFAYVWSTNGPEPVDRVFGLVDDNNWPVDSSYWALGQAYCLGTDVIPGLLQSQGEIQPAPLALLITN